MEINMRMIAIIILQFLGITACEESCDVIILPVCVKVDLGYMSEFRSWDKIVSM